MSKINYTSKDILGNTISIGDLVAVPGGHYHGISLYVCVVTKVSKLGNLSLKDVLGKYSGRATIMNPSSTTLKLLDAQIGMIHK